MSDHTQCCPKCEAPIFNIQRDAGDKIYLCGRGLTPEWQPELCEHVASVVAERDRLRAALNERTYTNERYKHALQQIASGYPNAKKDNSGSAARRAAREALSDTDGSEALEADA